MFNTSSSEQSHRELSEKEAVVAGPSLTPALEVNRRAPANPVQQVHYVGRTSPIPIPGSQDLECANPALHNVGSSNNIRQLEQLPACGSNQLANGLQLSGLSPPSSGIQGNVYQTRGVPERTVSVKASYCGNIMFFSTVVESLCHGVTGCQAEPPLILQVF